MDIAVRRVLIEESMNRARRIEVRRLRRGFRSLCFIVSVAPFAGGFGALTGVYNAAFGCHLMVEGHSLAAAVYGSAAEGLVPLGLGFAVALFAKAVLFFADTECRRLELEMI